jgi:catechol 2,3-dioxygenase-like lactoylglutathione lyase family enzyme
MSRVQLALNVSDIDEAVEFYSKLFAAEPSKRKPGYANFAIADPPLKLVLIEGDGGGTLNHLGVEVETSQEVEAAEARLSAEGMATTGVDDTTCCYALKTETWVNDPDGAPWEVYVKTGDAEQMTASAGPEAEAGQCCSPAAPSEAVAAGSSPAASCC